MPLSIRLTLIFLVLCAATCAAQGAAPQPFTFVQITDTHVGTGHGADNLRSALTEIARISPTPSFIVCTGDASEFGLARELTEYKRIVSQSSIPVFTIPGNHDTRWCEEGKERFARIVGPTYQSFDKMGWHIVLMDTSVVGEQHGCLDPGQIAWLKADLARLPEGTPIVLAMHHPPTLPSAASTRGDAALFEAIRPYNVRLVLTGHGHANRKWERDGVQLVMTKGTLDGCYRIITIDADTIKTAYEMADSGLFADTETPTKRSPTPPDLSLPSDLLSPSHDADASDPSHLSYSSHSSHPSGSTDPSQPDGPFLSSGPARVPDSSGSPSPTDGLRWKTNVGAAIQGDPILADGGAYVTTLAGELIRLDPANGEVRWRARIGGSIHGSAVPVSVARNGKTVQALACASSKGTTALVKASDGTLIWSKDIGSPVVATPAANGSRLYVTTGGGRLVALNMTDGASVSEYEIGPCQVTPVLADGGIFLGCWNRRFTALDAAMSTQRWTKKIGRSRYFAPASSTPLVTGDRIIITCPLDSNADARGVLALSRATGNTVWSKRLNAGYCSPATDGKRIFLTLTAGEVVALSPTDGKELWRTPTGSAASHQRPCVADGNVYVGSLGGKITCISASDGRKLWQIALDSRDTYFFTSPAVANGVALLAAMDGGVYCVDAAGPRRAVQDLPGSSE